MAEGERPEGLWRGVFPLRTDEEKNSALSPEKIEARLQKFFPKLGPYQIEYVNVYDVHQRVTEIVGLFGEFVGRARAVRRLGSAALDLCYVAAGRLDGFWESDLKPWDIAGGSLVVAEAGGRVTRMDGGPFSSRANQVLATNGIVHDSMLNVIHDFRSRQVVD